MENYEEYKLSKKEVDFLKELIRIETDSLTDEPLNLNPLLEHPLSLDEARSLYYKLGGLLDEPDT